jgi:pyridoxal 5'-phosphate synthase pdxT subunit
MPVVGVLSLQGDFREHLAVLQQLGAEGRAVRLPSTSTGSTHSSCLGEIHHDRQAGRALGTLRSTARDHRSRASDIWNLRGLDLCRVGGDRRRPAPAGCARRGRAAQRFGRQNDSFEADIDIQGFDRPFHAVFIRAPWVAKVGSAVDVLATVDDHPVMVRQGAILGTSFHPELTDDTRIHQMLLDLT